MGYGKTTKLRVERVGTRNVFTLACCGEEDRHFTRISAVFLDDGTSRESQFIPFSIHRADGTAIEGYIAQAGDEFRFSVPQGDWPEPHGPTSSWAGLVVAWFAPGDEIEFACSATRLFPPHASLRLARAWLYSTAA